MTEFIIQKEEKEEEISPPKKAKSIIISGPHKIIKKEEITKTLIKMFRAACNGKNYYKKWFPELKDTGDFEAAFIFELNKLVR